MATAESKDRKPRWQWRNILLPLKSSAKSASIQSRLVGVKIHERGVPLSPDSHPSFIKFHAGGHAFSADFERPICYQVTAQAPVSLSTAGGHGHARVDGFEAPRLAHFKSARSHVSGTYQDKETATSHAAVTVEGLNILDVITADRIAGRLASEHKPD